MLFCFTDNQKFSKATCPTAFVVARQKRTATTAGSRPGRGRRSGSPSRPRDGGFVRRAGFPRDRVRPQVHIRFRCRRRILTARINSKFITPTRPGAIKREEDLPRGAGAARSTADRKRPAAHTADARKFTSKPLPAAHLSIFIFGIECANSPGAYSVPAPDR